MKRKHVIISLIIILVLAIGYFFLSLVYHEPVIVIENMNTHSINDSTHVPFDLTIYVNSEKVFNNDISVHVLPQAEVEVDLNLGYNCIEAYSIKAELLDRYCGYFFLNNLVNVRFASAYRDETYIHFLEIGRWPPY